MPRRYSEREVSRALERIGFELVRQRGSHMRYRGFWRGQQRNVSIVSGRREIVPSLLSDILAQADLTVEELDALVRGERITE